VIAGYDGRNILKCFIKFFYFHPQKCLLKENSENFTICENNIIGVELVVPTTIGLTNRVVGNPCMRRVKSFSF
jgi:hypothetical protein